MKISVASSENISEVISVIDSVTVSVVDSVAVSVIISVIGSVVVSITDEVTVSVMELSGKFSDSLSRLKKITPAPAKITTIPEIILTIFLFIM